MIYRRLLALRATRTENVIARVRRPFRQEFRMLPYRPCLFRPGRHRSLISYDISNKTIYRHPTIISATSRERHFRSEKKSLVFLFFFLLLLSDNGAPKETQWQLAD